MSLAHVSDDDNLSSNPFLRYILSLLDAKQVLRCMRVNKQFYNTILNNWTDMQKISKNLSIEQKDQQDQIALLGVHCKFPGASYHFYIRTISVSASCYGYMQPVRSLFQKQLEDDRDVKITNHGEKVDMPAVKPSSEPKKSIVNSVLAKLRLRKSEPNRSPSPPIPRRPEFAGKFAVSDYIEGLSIVLDFLLSRCNLGSLKISKFDEDCSEKVFETILQCVLNARVMLLSTAHVYQLSKPLMGILRHIDAKRVNMEMTDVLNNSMRYLHTRICNISITIKEYAFLSLSPIALLIEEWQKGRRNIKWVQLSHEYQTFRFTVSQFRQMLDRFDRMAVISSSETDIKVFIARERGPKVLVIEYNKEGMNKNTRSSSRHRSEMKGGIVTVQQCLINKICYAKNTQ